MDSHTEKQPVGTQMSPSLNTMDNNNSKQNQIPAAAAHRTSASSPSLSLLPPPLPQRDARRNSYVLDALLTSKTARTADTTTVTNVAGVAGPPTPLDIYLSSEEDASSMGDLSDFDFDDDDLDFDEATGACTVELATTASVVRTNSNSSSNTSSSTAATSVSLPNDKTTTTISSQTHTRRHSHDTARVVSVVYAGKPSLVDLGLERAARRRSLNSRTSTSSSSSVGLSETRPSTSSGGSMLSTAPSTTVSPAKQHKRNSSSGSMMASFRARKLAMTASDTATINRSLVPTLTSLDTTMSPPHLPTHSPTSESAPVNAAAITNTPTTTTSTSQSDLVASPAIAAPARSYTTSMLMSGPSNTSVASSPRTPTFGYGTGNLLRGVTRSLTLSGRRGLGRKESAAADKTDMLAASPVLLPAHLPAETVNALVSSGHNNNAGNRKSLAMSVVSAMTSMTAPPPGPPNEEGQEENGKNSSVTPTSTVPRMALPPASIVVSKRSTGSSFLGTLTGRRRSLKLL
ncbi:hypothetical protein SEUCBS139899_008811 [Sporothrix eucalyptigena]